MFSFNCDYLEGAHEAILKRMLETNREQLPGYGEDHYSVSAKEKIREVCGKEDADVYFMFGGTQTNAIVIAALLRPFEGVIAAETGHVNVHEAGAIEHTGHKVLTLPQKNGKINAKDLKAYMEKFYADDSHDHMVFPGMVYISHPTEYGTLYTKDELKEIHDVCGEYDMPLFLDGARLGYGLASLHTDVTMKDIAELTDVFYIGGTKVGALCGEAIVFSGVKMPAHFLTFVKQCGAMAAKGRLIGLQFDTLFTDDLYMEVSRHAINMAERLKEILSGCGLKFFLESPTNQQFVILEDEQMENLKKEVGFSFWEKYDETHTVVRFATSWATTPEMLDRLEEILKRNIK